MSVPYEKSFATSEKSIYWSDKNGSIKPKDVSKSSHKKFWFECGKCQHSFDKQLYSIKDGKWCPFCTNQKLCDDNSCNLCFNKSFASSEKNIYWSDKNRDIKPRDVFKSTKKKYYFDCDKCNHYFEIRLDSININNWCSFCTNQKLCDDDSCKICFEKSFASNEKSIYWSNDKNKDIKPRNIFKSTNKTYYFNCGECGHSYDMRIDVVCISILCSYCSSKKLCNDESCKLCFEKSFASNEKNMYWSNKNEDIKPRDVFKSSDKNAWFNCDKCNHTFNTHISGVNIGYWCSFCSNKQLCEDETCKLCFDKSFASSEKSVYWSDKNEDVNPRNVFKISGKKYWFECNTCNSSFNSLMSNINKGCWCPYCVNKTETILYERLLSVYPTIQRQFKQDWCKRINCLPFDLCITEHKIIVELDGPQHFKQVMNWDSPENQLENDLFKEKCANDNGYSVIRIVQEDVLYNRYEWFKELCDAIKEIINGDDIVNVYMCKNKEYDKF